MNSERIKEIQENTAYPESVSVKQALLQVWNECSLPSLFKAEAMAVEISENVEPKLTAQEQSFFIAGFCECVKWLSSNDR